MQPGPIVVGFDPIAGAVQFGLWGKGKLLLASNEHVIMEQERAGEVDSFWVLTLPVRPLLETTDQAWLRLDFDSLDHHRRATMAIQKLEEGAYFLGTRRGFFWGDDFAVATAPLFAASAKNMAANSNGHAVAPIEVKPKAAAQSKNDGPHRLSKVAARAKPAHVVRNVRSIAYESLVEQAKRYMRDESAVSIEDGVDKIGLMDAKTLRRQKRRLAARAEQASQIQGNHV